jgi:hypothetical protein
MVTSLYSVAKNLVEDGTVAEGDVIYDSVKGIIDAAEDDGLGNDAGADTGDLWD